MKSQLSGLLKQLSQIKDGDHISYFSWQKASSSPALNLDVDLSKIESAAGKEAELIQSIFDELANDLENQNRSASAGNK